MRKRDWRIYADFAQILNHIAKNLYSEEQFGVELEETVYALDSTTIDLCLSLFPWAIFRKTKGAIKLHTLLDLRGNIPVFIEITDGKVHDVNILDILMPEFENINKPILNKSNSEKLFLYFFLVEKSNKKNTD